MSASEPRRATNAAGAVHRTEPDATGALNADISELDWHEYTCQCPSHRDCPNRADYVVHIHAIDACNEPGLTFGNRVELRCGACVVGLKAQVAIELAALNRIQYGIGRCSGCGAPIREVSDVVQEVHAL